MQRNVVVTLRLAKWKVLLAVDRDCEHALVSLHDRCSAIALMDVQINHKRLSDPFLLDEPATANRKVIEAAVTTAVVEVGVVRAASEVEGKPRL